MRAGLRSATRSLIVTAGALACIAPSPARAGDALSDQDREAFDRVVAAVRTLRAPWQRFFLRVDASDKQALHRIVESGTADEQYVACIALTVVPDLDDWSDDPEPWLSRFRETDDGLLRHAIAMLIARRAWGEPDVRAEVLRACVTPPDHERGMDLVDWHFQTAYLWYLVENRREEMAETVLPTLIERLLSGVEPSDRNAVLHAAAVLAIARDGTDAPATEQRRRALSVLRDALASSRPQEWMLAAFWVGTLGPDTASVLEGLDDRARFRTELMTLDTVYASAAEIDESRSGAIHRDDVLSVLHSGCWPLFNVSVALAVTRFREDPEILAAAKEFFSRNPNEDQRAFAVQALRAHPQSEIEDVVASWVDGDDPSAWISAVRALREARSTALASTSRDRRRRAIDLMDGLHGTAAPDRDILPELSALARAPLGPDEVRRLALALLAFDPPPTEAVPVLEEFVLDRLTPPAWPEGVESVDDGDVVRRALEVCDSGEFADRVVERVSGLSADGRLVALTTLWSMTAETHAVRAAARRDETLAPLVAMREELASDAPLTAGSTAQIETLARTGEWQERQRVMQLLVEHGRAAELRHVVLEGLIDADIDVRQAAAEAMKQIGDVGSRDLARLGLALVGNPYFIPDTSAGIVPWTDSSIVGELLDLGSSDDPEQWVGAVTLVQQLAPDDVRAWASEKPAWSRRLDMAQRRREWVAPDLVESNAEGDRMPDELLRDLEPTLASEHPRVRRWAIEVIGTYGELPTEIAPSLVAVWVGLSETAVFPFTDELYRWDVSALLAKLEAVPADDALRIADAIAGADSYVFDPDITRTLSRIDRVTPDLRRRLRDLAGASSEWLPCAEIVAALRNRVGANAVDEQPPMVERGVELVRILAEQRDLDQEEATRVLDVLDARDRWQNELAVFASPRGARSLLAAGFEALKRAPELSTEQRRRALECVLKVLALAEQEPYALPPVALERGTELIPVVAEASQARELLLKIIRTSRSARAIVAAARALQTPGVAPDGLPPDLFEKGAHAEAFDDAALDVARLIAAADLDPLVRKHLPARVDELMQRLTEWDTPATISSYAEQACHDESWSGCEVMLIVLRHANADALSRAQTARHLALFARTQPARIAQAFSELFESSDIDTRLAMLETVSRSIDHERVQDLAAAAMRNRNARVALEGARLLAKSAAASGDASRLEPGLDSRSSEVRGLALRAFDEAGPSQQAATALSKRLESKDEELRRAVFALLEKWCEHGYVKAVLASALDSESAETRIDALRVVARLGAGMSGLVEERVEAILEDGGSEQRVLEAAIEAVLSVPADSDNPWRRKAVLAALSCDCDSVQRRAAEEIARLEGWREPRVIRAMAERLADDGEPAAVRRLAAGVLSDAVRSDPPIDDDVRELCVEALTAGIVSSDQVTKWAAASAWTQLPESRSEQLVAWLGELLNLFGKPEGNRPQSTHRAAGMVWEALLRRIEHADSEGGPTDRTSTDGDSGPDRVDLEAPLAELSDRVDDVLNDRDEADAEWLDDHVVRPYRASLRLLGESPLKKLRDLVVAYPEVSGPVLYLSSLLLLSALLLWLRPVALLRFGQIVSAIDFKIGQIPVRPGWLLVVTFFQYNPRVLDHWVRLRLERARKRYEKRPTVRDRRDYVPLPSKIGDQIVESPQPVHFRPLFDRQQLCVLIWGEGGAGKTSLACALGRYAFDPAPERRLTKHPMLPVLLEDELPGEPDHDAFLAAVKVALHALVGDEEKLDDQLFRKLLRRRRVLVIIDHFSEMTDATRRAVLDAPAESPVNALVVTSRVRESLQQRVTDTVEPQRIDVRRLVQFMSRYLELKNVRPLDEDLIEALRRLMRITRGRSITALLVTMYGDLFVAGPDSADGATPHRAQHVTSVRELMYEYVSSLNRNRPPDGPENGAVHAALRVIAWETVRSRFRPGARPRGEIIAALDDNAEREVELTMSGRDGRGLLEYLVDHVRCVELAGVNETDVRIVLDPVAEYLAADHCVREIAADAVQWQSLIESLQQDGHLPKEHRGFAEALKDVVSDYDDDPDHPVPDFVATRLAKLLADSSSAGDGGDSPLRRSA